MKTDKQIHVLPKRYKSVDTFVKAKLDEAKESVKKIDFTVLNGKKVPEK